MPLCVIVELLSFANLSKLYSAMYRNEQDVIAKSVGSSSKTLKNHLHCLANLRNKVAHAGRLYNAKFNPPAILGKTYLQKNSDILTDTLFAYIIIITRRLPQRKQQELFLNCLFSVFKEYEHFIDLSLLGFPSDYSARLIGEIK